MARDTDGFPIADIDVGLLDDPKVRRLARLSGGDEATLCRALVAYLSTVIESWAEGRRVPLAEAAPIWITAVAELERRLSEAGLLDGQGMVPEASWESWYGPAHARREQRRLSGAIGGRKRHQSDAQATPELGSTRSVSVSVPMNGEVRRPETARARPKPSTVDRDPLYRQIRAAQEERYKAEDDL